MPDGCFASVEDFVLATPEHQLAHVFGESARRSHDEVQRGGDGSIEIGIAHQLPADLVNERQANVEDDEVDIREVGCRSVHIPGLGMFDGLRAKRYAFMHADGMYAQFTRFFKDGEGYSWVVHTPREWLAIIVANVVEFEGFGAVLFDLAFHQVQRLLTFQWVDRAPEDRPVGIFLCHCSTLFPLRQSIIKEVGERQRLGHDHIGTRFLEDHLGDFVDVPLAQKLFGSEHAFTWGCQHLVKGIQVVDEHLTSLAISGVHIEVEDMTYAVKYKGVVVQHD